MGNRKTKEFRPEVIIELLSEYGLKSSQGRKEKRHLLKHRIKQEETGEMELLAMRFLSRLPLYLKDGLLEQIGYEQDPPGQYEESGWRKRRISILKGWIAVYKYGEYFGSENRAKLPIPSWLSLAVEKLRKDGWTIEFKNFVDVEPGIGNTISAYVCVRDPRVADKDVR